MSKQQLDSFIRVYSVLTLMAHSIPPNVLTWIFVIFTIHFENKYRYDVIFANSEFAVQFLLELFLLLIYITIVIFTKILIITIIKLK